jgi:hypothetical protein
MNYKEVADRYNKVDRIVRLASNGNVAPVLKRAKILAKELKDEVALERILNKTQVKVDIQRDLCSKNTKFQFLSVADAMLSLKDNKCENDEGFNPVALARLVKNKASLLQSIKILVAMEKGTKKNEYSYKETEEPWIANI